MTRIDDSPDATASPAADTATAPAPTDGVPPTPVCLTVDHQHSPLGVAVPRPVLAWQVPGAAPAVAHEVEVRRLDPVTGTAVGPPVWATGRVEVTDPPMNPWLPYDGEPLVSDCDYAWRVRIWTRPVAAGTAMPGGTEPGPSAPPPADVASAWAESTFSTSLLGPDDVVAPWVKPEQTPVEPEPPVSFETLFAPQDRPPAGERLHPVKLVRQDLRLGGAPITRARLYSSAQGVIELRIDGRRVGDTVLAPGWTSYDVRTEFEVHNVTDLLREPDGGILDDSGTPGTHTLGLLLGDGWFGGRMTITGESAQYGTLLRAWWQLSLTRADGTHEVGGADSPRATPPRSTESGPIRYSDIMVGEKRDDRLATADAGWDRPGFDDDAAAQTAVRATTAQSRPWAPARIVPAAELYPPAPLEPFRGEPVRRLAELPVVEVLTTPAGQTVLDFGQVIAGRVRLSVPDGVGRAGREIVLEHSEHLAADGTFFSNVQGPNKDQRDVWVLAGTGMPEAPEVYEPTFTFHGFRYVRVTGYPGELRPGAATAVVVGSDLEATGRFACSDPRLNRLHNNVVWSQRANFLSIPTDCPQRERVGWTGDIQVFAPAATNNAEVHGFLARWLRNLRADQRPDGRIPIVSPFPPSMAALEGQPGIGGIVAAAGWGDAIIRVPLALWERYGDVDTLAASYGAMRAWVEMQTEQAATELPPRLRGGEWDDADRTGGREAWAALSGEDAARQRLLWNSRLHFGDWLAPSTLASDSPDAVMVAPRLTSEFVGAAFHTEALRTLSRVARVLGHEEDAVAFRARWEEVRAAVGAEYVQPDGSMSPDLQGMYVLALAFDLVPEGLRAAAVGHLVRLVHEAGDHLDTGFLSIPFLLDVLEGAGRADVAWRLLMRDTVPSWLYEVEEDATTIWESWSAVAPDGTVGAMSFNHYAFGAVDDWMFRRLAGIEAAEPGFRRVRVAPLVDGPVDWAEGERLTPYGLVRVRWERCGEGDLDAAPTARPRVRYEVELPAGVAGELVGPDGAVVPLSPGPTRLER